MSDRDSGEQPFDERAALEELELVRKEIERYQAQRKTLEEEFDRFTASFKQPIPVPAPSVPAPRNLKNCLREERRARERAAMFARSISTS